MIKIETQQYLFAERHPFDFTRISEDERKVLRHIDVREIIIQDLINVDKFDSIFSEVLQTLLIDNKVYFIFNSRIPAKKERLRSFKKLFYDYRKILGKENFVDFEFDLEEDQSIFLGLIRVTPQNFDHILNIPLSSLAFGYLVPKNQRSFTKSREHFLQSIFDNCFLLDKELRVNFLKILVEHINKNSFLRIRSTGRDEEIISLFGGVNHQEGIVRFTNQVKLEMSN
jgi:hypothetical protein